VLKVMVLMVTVIIMSRSMEKRLKMECGIIDILLLNQVGNIVPKASFLLCYSMFRGSKSSAASISSHNLSMIYENQF